MHDWQLDKPILDLRRGNSPLLISIPHDGRDIPREIAARMTDAGRSIADTDWDVRRLYGFAESLDATLVCANYSRYVVDLNRPPDGQPLYPGQNETSLCPLTTFDNADIYRSGMQPGPDEIVDRRQVFWQPYHSVLESELSRLGTIHDRVLLWDAHSIRSMVPRFFSGLLPDFNFGTADGLTLPSGVRDRLVAEARTEGCSAIGDGRFKGGYITRHYGNPERGRFAIQLELAQSTYMDEARGRWLGAPAAATSDLIRTLCLIAVEALARS